MTYLNSMRSVVNMNDSSCFSSVVNLASISITLDKKGDSIVPGFEHTRFSRTTCGLTTLNGTAITAFSLSLELLPFPTITLLAFPPTSNSVSTATSFS